MYFGFLSLLPPVIAIVLAIRTKQVFLSLIFGIWLGWLVVTFFQYHGIEKLSEFGEATKDTTFAEGIVMPLEVLFEGTLNTVQALVDVFKDDGNTRTIFFCALVGALIIFIQRSGGVEGFIGWINKILVKYEARKEGSNRVIVQLMAWLTGMVIFVETSISVLTVGTLYRPIFDRLKIPREKLAYIADSSSAPASILIPFNGWGAFIMALLLAQGFDNPFAVMINALVYNFYPMLALLFVLFIILSQRDFGPMAKAEKRAREEGKVMADDAVPMIADELTDVPIVEGVKPKAYNMVIPIAIMVFLMPIMLMYTGWGAAMTDMPDAGFGEKAFYAIGKGSGSTSVLVAVIAAILFSFALYSFQGIMKVKEMVELTLKGISGLMPLALLMLMAFAIGAVCKELGTGQYVADVAKAWLSPKLVPFIVFLVSCFIAFSTGTSWGTFAIMIAIAVPMAQNMEANVYLTIAAALGGGVFGDHCSPISDTSILSSMASASDHIDHVKTQLPYALVVGVTTAVLYLIVGAIS
ncbi:MAG: Na+/H+ antiporter NhaC family protein [Bacteroidota bacterium]